MGNIIYTPGRFVWHELFTANVDAAKDFYGPVVGWRFETKDMGGRAYTMILSGESMVGGLVEPPSSEAAERWVGMVSVPDVDEASAAAKTAGGRVLVPKTEIGIGHYNVVADPDGNLVMAWKANEGDPPEVEKPAVGSPCWDELCTQDVAAAEVFYAKLFGWTAEDFSQGGPMRVFKRGERQAASARPCGPEETPGWLCYLNVENLATARGKVSGLGGRVLVEDQAIPNVGRFSLIEDPNSARVALFQAGA